MKDIKSNFFKNIFSGLVDIIYPVRCHACQKFLEENEQGGLAICSDCLKSFVRITSPFCSVCRTPFISRTGENHHCENCLRKRPQYEALGAPFLYEGVLMGIIHQFKYSGKSHYADSLGHLLASFARQWLIDPEHYLMMPVPLHPKKLRQRGFNQSLLLARIVSSIFNAELDFLSLKRIKYSIAQTGLSKKERIKNVRKAFEYTGDIDIKDRTIVLVDDVATTGSTLNECARILKKSGCKKVFGLVLARTSG
ncbi:ComF family protein [Thermodesulfobacteriota bacterium]